MSAPKPPAVRSPDIADPEDAKPKKPTIERFDQLGEMPDDPLLMNQFAHRALGVAMKMVTAAKKKLSKWEQQQIRIVNEISSKMVALTPISRLAAAEDVVMGRNGGDRGPKTEATAGASQVAASNSTYRGPPARRGRPRRGAVR